MQNIQNIISLVIKTLYWVDFTPEISPAPKPELGEYCIWVFQLAKPAGKSPNIIAEEVAKSLSVEKNIFLSTSATGGYVNFFLTDAVWMEIFWGVKNDKRTSTNQRIIIDYIGANVGKPLHIGHICTPSIGQVISNVYRHLGYDVTGDSHFGDWGGIFGKLIWAWNDPTSDYVNEYNDTEINTILLSLKNNKDFSHQKAVKELQLEKYGVDYLMKLYQKWFTSIREEDKEMLENDARKEFQYLSWVGIDLSNDDERRHHEENVELWKKFTSISIAETEKKLGILNVKATYNIGESFYEWLGLPRPNNEDYPELEFNMKSIVQELINKWIATPNEDGSVGVLFPEDSKLPSCILQKKDGTGLYLTSDLAAIKYRLTNGWNPNKIIYSVDVRQQLHLRQAFWIAQKAWWEELWAEKVEFFHAFNGFIKLKEGAMSTRHGTVIFLEALIDEGKLRTQKILHDKWRIGEKALSLSDIDAVTVWAIKYSYLAQDREKDVTFDWDKALNFEGNSAPYIQYAYVRAKKISEQSVINSSESNNVALSVSDKSLIQTLARMDSIIENVAKTYKPHHLALYAYDLAVAFNSFYVHTPKILEEKDENLKNFRLSLVEKTAKQLQMAFELLAIKMPSEM